MSPTTPAEPKKIEHPCLNCGRHERAEITGILCEPCQKKVRKTWGSRAEEDLHKRLNRERHNALMKAHRAGKRPAPRLGPNGGWN